MPCDTKRRLDINQQLQAQRERERALREIEEALATGRATLVKTPTGFRLVGVPLPTGMYDACALAALQQRGSAAFKQAQLKAQAQAVNFIQQHALMHQNKK